MANTVVIVGTPGGLRVGGRPDFVALDGIAVRAVTTSDTDIWALTGDNTIWRGSLGGPWHKIVNLERYSGTCILSHRDSVLVGTSEAHLLRLSDGDVSAVHGFDALDQRESWYTPWGGPPDVRSMAATDAGGVYVNVHVGGVVKSQDAGETWEPSGLDIHADAHQVLAHPSIDDLVFAACGRGLATSTDAGDSWKIDAQGMHAFYCRAVAATPDHVLVSASLGPGGREACLYRRRQGDPGSVERCRNGLPDWFDGNIDTGCLASDGSFVAFGTRDGRVFASDDEGDSWRETAVIDAQIDCLAIAPEG